jgi:3-deoxy-D-manno-octulosonate 8-phosphate phosphatase (KDO 8-P phosphatase)
MSDGTTRLPQHSEIGASVRMVVFDFDGVFTDNTVWTDSAGAEWVRCWRGDGIGLQLLRDLGIPCWVLSTEVDQVVSRRCAKLGVLCRQGLVNKHEALDELATEAGIKLEAIVYVGNDINDAACLRMAGVPIVVLDAHPDVLPLARYQTRAAGGFGAVREVCEWVTSSVQFHSANAQ